MYFKAAITSQLTQQKLTIHYRYFLIRNRKMAIAALPSSLSNGFSKVSATIAIQETDSGLL